MRLDADASSRTTSATLHQPHPTFLAVNVNETKETTSMRLLDTSLAAVSTENKNGSAVVQSAQVFGDDSYSSSFEDEPKPTYMPAFSTKVSTQRTPIHASAEHNNNGANLVDRAEPNRPLPVLSKQRTSTILASEPLAMDSSAVHTSQLNSFSCVKPVVSIYESIGSNGTSPSRNELSAVSGVARQATSRQLARQGSARTILP
jgi:hypothetical protein